jgi:hypothetical protein
MGNGGNIEKPLTEAEEILRQNLYVEQIVSAVVVLYEEKKVTQKCFSFILYLGKFYLHSLCYLLRLVRIARLDAGLATKNEGPTKIAGIAGRRIFGLASKMGMEQPRANEPITTWMASIGWAKRDTLDFFSQPENLQRLCLGVSALSKWLHRGRKADRQSDGNVLQKPREIENDVEPAPTWQEVATELASSRVEPIIEGLRAWATLMGKIAAKNKAEQRRLSSEGNKG